MIRVDSWPWYVPQGPQIYFTRSLEIEEVDLCDHIGIGMNIGGSNMILTIQNHAIHNVAV